MLMSLPNPWLAGMLPPYEQKEIHNIEVRQPILSVQSIGIPLCSADAHSSCQWVKAESMQQAYTRRRTQDWELTAYTHTHTQDADASRHLPRQSGYVYQFMFLAVAYVHVYACVCPLLCVFRDHACMLGYSYHEHRATRTGKYECVCERERSICMKNLKRLSLGIHAA